MPISQGLPVATALSSSARGARRRRPGTRSRFRWGLNNPSGVTDVTVNSRGMGMGPVLGRVVVEMLAARRR